MRRLGILIVVIAAASTPLPCVRADDKVPPRYGVDYDGDNYPQKSAKSCLASVVKAIEARRIDYLLAYLADPKYVDSRVKALGGFREVVEQTRERLAADPTVLRELQRFLSSGEWQEGEDAASAKLKDVKGRAVFFKKVDERWFFENRQKAETKD